MLHLSRGCSSKAHCNGLTNSSLHSTSIVAILTRPKLTPEKTQCTFTPDERRFHHRGAAHGARSGGVLQPRQRAPLGLPRSGPPTAARRRPAGPCGGGPRTDPPRATPPP